MSARKKRQLKHSNPVINIPRQIKPTEIQAVCATPPGAGNDVILIDEIERAAPYDKTLLAELESQWALGDWQSLAQLPRDKIEHHPDRTKLVLLVAAGQLQLGQDTEAQQCIRLAQDWGVEKRLISQILIAGLHNSLGRIYLAIGKDKSALDHFETAIHIMQPDNADRRLFSESHAVHEATQLGLLTQAAQLVNDQLNQAKAGSGQNEALLKILQTEVELLHHELSLAQQRQQLFTPKAAKDPPTIGSDEWKAQLQRQSVSQLGQDLWVLKQTNYKRGGFFIEFGATDGVLLSNTWLLEKEFGWQGICAEPNPKFFTKLKQNRGCTLSDQCIGGKTGEQVEFIFADAYGGNQKYADEDQHKDKRAAYRAAGHMSDLTSISLHDFLQQHKAPKDIDYISIDTEGSEYKILQSFPFDKWNIRLLTVEHNFTKRRKDIRKVLEDNGYRCQERQWDDWFEKI